MDEVLGDLVDLMVGPGGVREVSGRLDEALHGRLSVLEACGGDVACFVERRRLAGPPTEVRALLEEYLDGVLKVWQEAERVVAAGLLAEGGGAAVEAAGQWYEAAELSARAALAAVECLQDVEPEQSLGAVERCSYQRDLFAAAVHDQNRLRQEFERAYSVFVQGAGAGQPA